MIQHEKLQEEICALQAQNSSLQKKYPNTLEEIERMSKIPYALMIESLMYAMLCT